MKNKKISFLIPSFNYGGAEKNAVLLSNYFIEKNYNVDILVINDTGILKERLNQKIKVINLKSSRSLYSIFKIVKYLNNEKPNILFSTLVNLNAISVISKKIAKHKFLLILREANIIRYKYENEFKITNLISYLCIKYLYNYSDFIISICEYIFNDLKKLHINTKIIYSPIIFENIKTLSKKKDFEIKINQKYPIILSIGRFEKQKNLKLLIKSFVKINKIKKSFLLIIGDGNEYQKIINEIKDNNLEDSVILLKKTNNVFKYMKVSTLLINTSLWEGLSNVLVESIFMKLPVICTDCPGGNKEIIDKLGGGKIISNHNSSIISDEAIKILNGKKYDYKDENLNLFTLEKNYTEYENLINNNL